MNAGASRLEKSRELDHQRVQLRYVETGCQRHHDVSLRMLEGMAAEELARAALDAVAVDCRPGRALGWRAFLNATQMRHGAVFFNNFKPSKGTENPRVGGSIPPLGTIQLRWGLI